MKCCAFTLGLTMFFKTEMEVGYALRPVRDFDNHAGCHFLEHKKKKGLRPGEIKLLLKRKLEPF